MTDLVEALALDGRKPRANATLLLGQLALARDVYGDRIVDRALLGMPDFARRELVQAPATSWLPYEVSVAVHTALGAQLGRTAAEFRRAIVRQALPRTLSRVWRIAMRWLGDESLVKRAPLIYHKTYDRGRFWSEMEGPGRARLHLREWPEPTELDLAGIEAAVETVLELAGREGVSVKAVPLPDGADFTASWRVG